VLNGWKPRNPPEGYAIEPPGSEYWEDEAAREWGLDLRSWLELAPWYRARMTAHCIERRLRDAHFKDWELGEMKKREKAAAGGSGGAEKLNPMERLKRDMGLG
jgi:hypothetical protein